MHRTFSSWNFNYLFYCYFNDCINNIISVIESFDTFWNLGIISKSDHQGFYWHYQQRWPIPQAYQNNYIPCWDVESESLHRTFCSLLLKMTQIWLLQLCLPSLIGSRRIQTDDLALLHSSGNWKDLEGTLSQDMSTLSAHLQTWRL